MSSLICRKNDFQSNKVNTINNLLRSTCDLLGFHFIDNSSKARYHLAGDRIHLNYAGAEVLLEKKVFVSTISCEMRQAKIMNHLIDIFQ